MSFSRFLPGHARELTLEHGRVRLRPPRAADWSAWAGLRQTSRDFLEPWEPSWPAGALTRQDFRRRLRQYAFERREDSGYAFFIFHRDSDALLGGITLANLRRGVAQTGSIGYWMGKPHARQGYMSEALVALLDFCFGELNLHRIEAACLPHNVASRKLLEKCGFQGEGYARNYLKINGKWQDHLLFGVLAEDHREWRRKGERPPPLPTARASGD
jgi:ribosomal-protein-alanine N-acetyltransferase